MARTIFLCLMLVTLGCRNKLRVERITDPDYPFPARFEGLQGTVAVMVTIDSSGRVTYARGSGAPDMLVKAAEANAHQWVFGPFPAISEFPLHHTIQYVYKLEGKPKVVALQPVIKTFLPDRIEISAVPLVSDYPPIEEYKPTSKTK